MKKILIIEDDPVVASIYKNKLLGSGFDVVVAQDGDAGLRLLQLHSPDLVLLDLGLPKVNGVEVLKSIRANPGTATSPVVVLSNSYVTDLVQAAWKAGANRCLTKASCTPANLIAIIHSLLSPPEPASPKPAAPPDPDKPAPEIVDPERSDAAFQLRIRQSFLASGATVLADLRRRFQSFAQKGADSRPSAEILEFYGAVHSLTGNAGVAGFIRIAALCAALEALLKELHEKPKNLGPSPIRTIANAIDILPELFNTVAVTTSEESLPPAILVVDDDAISRRTISLALEKARLRAIVIDDPLVALRFLEQNSFDLIFSDVNMPEMNGFEFCAKVRAIPAHAGTPLVFVTSQTDFESRANSKLSGGTDLIGKPFLLVELAVKALTLLQRRK